MSEKMAPETVVTTGNSRFDPARYLTKLPRRARGADGQWQAVELDYMEVKWRLLWLRTEHPDAAISTELAQLDLDRNLAVFRAHVAIPGGGSATGWGSETAEDWRDFIEKAETKALGRALAALGFGTQFCEDFDFSQGNENKIVDAPVQLNPARAAARPQVMRRGLETPPPAASAPAQNGTTGGWAERPATEAQIKAIYAIARGTQAMDDGSVDELVRGRYNCSPADLSRRQASEMIDALKLGAAS